MSAWIEINLGRCEKRKIDVALLVSAWIEITVTRYPSARPMVALLVSAWIEIDNPLVKHSTISRRTPRECVD